MRNKERIKKVEEYFNNLDQLFFENLDKNNVYTNCHDLLLLANKYNTIKSNGGFYCMRGKQRSISDLYRLAVSIGYKAGLYNFYKDLFSFVNNTTTSDQCSTYICKDIDKRVYWLTSNSSVTGDLTDEYGIDLSEFTAFRNEAASLYNVHGKIQNVRLT